MCWGSTCVRLHTTGFSLPRRGVELCNCNGGGVESGQCQKRTLQHGAGGVAGKFNLPTRCGPRAL